MSNTPVIVRMPPSPTGSLHLGTARTALFNWVFAKRQQGEIIFRWEDTDLERSKAEYESEIMEGLAWLGMDFATESKAVIRQTDCQASHETYLQQLWKAGQVYPCFVSSDELDTLRDQAQKAKKSFVFWGPDRDLDRSEAEKRMQSESYVWRLKTPRDTELNFEDAIRGTVTVSSETIGDFVVARADGSVLYLLANVVDDHTQGITHVVRGEDHISNTPKQLLIWQALNLAPPIYAHLPLVLDHKGAKLSKRNVDPEVCVLVSDFQREGFLPEGVVNGLAFLGWNPKSTEEYFTLEQIAATFAFDQINPAGAKYDYDKMRFFNHHWLRTLPLAEVLQAFGDWHTQYGSIQNLESIDLETAVDVLRDKARTFRELEVDLEYLVNAPEVGIQKLAHEKMKVNLPLAQQVLDNALMMLRSLNEAEFKAATLKQKCVEQIQAMGLKNGQFLWPMRYSLSGRDKSTGPFEMMAILGKAESLRRIERVLGKF